MFFVAFKFLGFFKGNKGALNACSMLLCANRNRPHWHTQHAYPSSCAAIFILSAIATPKGHLLSHALQPMHSAAVCFNAL